MKIAKVINNNIISSFDENDKEIIAMGRGIGFGKKPGDEISDEKIEKVFRIKSHDTSEQFKELLADIPFEHLKIANEVITYAKKRFHLKLNQSIYVTLTDHINFAIQRFHQNIKPENALLWEIQSFYNAEYQVGKYAIKLIKEKLDIEMNDDEAGFIALHFVNAEYETTLSTTMQIPNMIKDILHIVKEEMGITLDQHSIHYERFLTHLKFLLQRVYKHELLNDEEEDIFTIVQKKYPKEAGCSKRIVQYIEEKTGIPISEEEAMYLIIHIRRVQTYTEKEDLQDID